MRKKLGGLAAAAALAASPLAAATTTIDFDDLSVLQTEIVTQGETGGTNPGTGTRVTGINLFDGLVGVSDPDAPNGAGLFDAVNPSGNDDDLVDPFDRTSNPGEFKSFGNILVSLGNADDDGLPGGDFPNDFAGPSAIIFDFTNVKPVFLHALDVLDVDENVALKIFADGIEVGSVFSADGEWDAFAPLSRIRIDNELRVEFPGSGGIDNLTFAEVPVPAALPLMAGGLGLLAALRRRKAA